MASKAPLRAVQDRQPLVCTAAEGCSYLRALSVIEHVAGFERTARSYAASAHKCRGHGCFAALTKDGGHAADRSGTGMPIVLKAVQNARSISPIANRIDAGQTVTFSRSAQIDIVSDTHGNYVERRALKVDNLPERGDPLGYLYHYWRDLRVATDCHFSDIDTVHLTRAGIIGKLHLVDVSSSDPGDFRYELLGYAVPVRYLERPCAHPVAIYAETTMRDYNTVRLTAAPHLQRVRSRLDGISFHYTRLILPFLDARGQVTRLAVAIRQEAGDGVKVESGD